jgi:hypothetical protein
MLSENLQEPIGRQAQRDFTMPYLKMTFTSQWKKAHRQKGDI